MKLTDELIKKIKEIFSNDIEKQNKLLNLDVETIRELGREANSNFTFDDIIISYESDSMDELYEEAKNKKRYSNFYFERVGEKSAIRK